MNSKSNKKINNDIAMPQELMRIFSAIARRDESLYNTVPVRTKSKRSYVDELGNKVLEEQEGSETILVPPDLREVMRAAEILLSAHEKQKSFSENATPGIIEIPVRASNVNKEVEA